MSRALFVPRFAPQVIREAAKIVVSLSYPSKMPCPSYDLPARACITGAKLVNVKGTVCNGCYALAGFSSMPNQEKIMYRRLANIKKYGIRWAHAMAAIINYYNLPFFRWHSSGDLQGVWHLFLLNEVAWKTPKTKYWLATREWGMVRKFIEDYKQTVAPNLRGGIRLSANEFDSQPPVDLARRLGVTCSAVSSNGTYTCLASKNKIEVNNYRHNITEGHCGACRDCWDPEHFIVIYKRH